MEIIIVLVALAIAYAVYKAYFVKPAAEAEVVQEAAPYKVEEPVVEVAETVVETAPVKKPRAPRKPKAANEKKPAVKAKTARKPKAK